NVKLRRALEEHEARFTNLEQRDKEKTNLIAKLDDDIKEIKQTSTNTSSFKNPNNAVAERQLEKMGSQRDLARPSNTSDNTSNSDSQLHKKVAENIVKDVFDFTATSTSEKNHATEILLTPVSENHVTENN
ncbi:1003_t:CDS:2, partial [Racocetra persica]